MSLKIAIVGGGIASLVAGISLRERLPNCEITLYSAAGEKMIGGQLASWNEQGYPVEHGLHALFGFYGNILPLLKKVGAYENLTRSKEHIFVRERGAIHRFDLRTWPATYHGFTAAEKLRCLAAAPAIGKFVFDVKRKGSRVYDAYDQHDLRTLAGAHGVPDSVLQSGFFRQFYEAAFNAPSELSAAVALESIYKIFSKRWHYYFNSPTRESIIAPLQRHLTEHCGGRIEFNQKLLKVRADDAGLRVSGLDFEDQETGRRYSVGADEYVLALGLEDFKMVDFGAGVSEHDYFRNVHKLQTVSSFSIQAWFKEDPVPAGIDSMITGMPQPFGILCPITRVRATPPCANLALRYELIATGPERGYEDTPDEAIKAGFIQGLRDAGFTIPGDPAHMHVVLRRNREPFHRYLLTRPGELQWRPAHQSPLQNLCLAGAWVRNDFALPCVDAAAEGAMKVAGLIAARVPPLVKNAGRSAEIPRSSPLVLPPPYHFPRSTASLFLLDANPERLADLLPADLKLLPGFGGKLLFAVVRHEDVYAESDPSGARYSYNEVLFGAFVREKKFNPIGKSGLYPVDMYVDDDMAMAAGRETYGFPKKMASIEYCAHQISLARRGEMPEATAGIMHPIDDMSARWTVDPHLGAALAGEAPQVKKSHIAFSLLGKMTRQVAFYNTLHAAQAGARHCDQLTKVALSTVEVRRVSGLHGLRLRVDASVNNSIYQLLRADCNTAEICAARGVEVELAFAMGPVQILRPARVAPGTPALGPMVREKS